MWLGLTETLLTEAIWFWFWQCTLCIQWRGNAYTKCMVSLFPAPFSARTSEACHRPMTHRRLSARPGHGRRFFFSANEDCISANHMARILIWRRISLTSRKHLQYVYAHVHVCTMYLKYAPYDWLKYWGMAILVSRRRKIAHGRGPTARGQSVHGSVYCTYKWGVSQTDDSPSLIGLTPWRTMWSVCSRLRLLHIQLWGVSQTNDLPLINQQPLIQMRHL